MPVNILMPALSPTMEKGKLAKWLKKEGDKVKSGDVLAEIETDKATMEVEAIDEGTLGKILVAEGTDDVLVNAPIAIILGEGEKLGDLPKAAPAPAAKPAAAPAARRCANRFRRRARHSQRPMAPAFLPHRWPSALPSRRALTSRPSKAPAPMAASS